MPFLKISSGRVFYADFTPNSSHARATLILHHGLGSTHAYYSSIIPSLTATPHNFRCITYDTISSGLSDLATQPQSIQSLANGIIEVLDGLGVKDKAIMVGHSMGGVVASEVAATKGDRIKATIMLGPVLPSQGVKEAFEGRVRTVEKGG